MAEWSRFPSSHGKFAFSEGLKRALSAALPYKHGVAALRILADAKGPLALQSLTSSGVATMPEAMTLREK